MAAGREKVFTETVSSEAQRAELEHAMEFVREGDVFMSTKPDRLARLETKGVGLVILSIDGQQLDTKSPIGKLMLTILAAIAVFDRRLMLERQREGIAKAKADGKYRGRAPTALRRTVEVMKLRDDGVKPTEIAKRFGIGSASVYRIVGGQLAA